MGWFHKFMVGAGTKVIKPLSPYINPFHEVQVQAKEEAAAEKQVQAEDTNRLLAWSDAQRQASIANRQAALRADEITEEARAKAIQGYQGAGAGAAALAASGAAPGSSSYSALAASISESERSLDLWRRGAGEDLDIALEGSGAALARARTANSVNEGILSDRLGALEDSPTKSYGYWLASGMSNVIDTALSLYSVTSNVQTAFKAAKGANLKIGDFLTMDSKVLQDNLIGARVAAAQGLDYEWNIAPKPAAPKKAAKLPSYFDDQILVPAGQKTKTFYSKNYTSPLFDIAY